MKKKVYCQCKKCKTFVLQMQELKSLHCRSLRPADIFGEGIGCKKRLSVLCIWKAKMFSKLCHFHQCWKKKFAFSVRKIKKICIPNAKYKRNLHSQWQNFFKIAFPVPKIKKICIPSAKNKKSILPMQKMQKICIANPIIKNLHC